MNTESRSFSNQGIKHTEGGWPKDVDPSDAEHTIRYRKKVEKDEEYLRQVAGLGEVACRFSSLENEHARATYTKTFFCSLYKWE